MAHVMTYKEIEQAAKDQNIIYEESKSLGIIRPLRFDGSAFVGVHHSNYFLLLEECDEKNCIGYNLFYRCWNEEPSVYEMEETKWNSNPSESFIL